MDNVVNIINTHSLIFCKHSIDETLPNFIKKKNSIKGEKKKKKGKD